jgi:hypothetical protein
MCNGGGMPKVFIGLNQGLTKAGEEGVVLRMQLMDA